MNMVIGEKVFRTKKEARNYISGTVLNNQGEINKNNSHFNFFLDLMNRHPDSESKIYKEIKCFIFGRNIGGHAHIDIKFVDDSKTDVSWTACLSGKRKDPKNNLTQAMRSAIGWQIFEYRKSSNKICEICLGEVPDDDIHIDHEIPFKKIMDTFLEEHHAPIEFADCPVSHKTIFRPEDINFQKSWEQFHLNIAILRVAHSQCNLRRSKF